MYVVLIIEDPEISNIHPHLITGKIFMMLTNMRQEFDMIHVPLAQPVHWNIEPQNSHPYKEMLMVFLFLSFQKSIQQPASNILHSNPTLKHSTENLFLHT